MGGMSRFLTEVRSVVKSPNDVMDLWDCSPDEDDEISCLGIDLGQAFVVDACALFAKNRRPKE
ncbi:hypothetical protein BG006_003379, partial [Podila minutissima]